MLSTRTQQACTLHTALGRGVGGWASMGIPTEHTEHPRKATGLMEKWVSGQAVQLQSLLCEFILTCSASPSAPSAARGETPRSVSPRTPEIPCWEKILASFLPSLRSPRCKDLGKQSPWMGLWCTVPRLVPLLILYNGTGRNTGWVHPNISSLLLGTGCSPRGHWEEENKG